MLELMGEKCAVMGVSSRTEDIESALIAQAGLAALQHRGPEASGIAYSTESGRLDLVSGDGMVKDVFRDGVLLGRLGHSAVGHNRYATSGPKSGQAQPIIDRGTGTAVAHNGNLPVTRQLEVFLKNYNIVTQGLTDSEMMARAIFKYVNDGFPLARAVETAYPLLRGAFMTVAMRGSTVVGVKDKCGIRPGVIGETDSGLVIASETCALDSIGARFVRDIGAGEMVVLHKGEIIEQTQVTEPDPKFDAFELVYFMRPDSKHNGETIFEMRRRAGKELAEEHGPRLQLSENTLVVPVPATSVPAAEGFAAALRLESGTAIIKNSDSGRSFLIGSEEERQRMLLQKHSIIDGVIRGRDVILIDDSIVRLNTLPRLVAAAIRAGAKSVTVLIASPPVRFPDFYGIDTPTQAELAAANMTIEEMRAKVGADYLGFLSLSRLIRSTGIPREQLNLSCFTGEYPIGIGRRMDEIRKPEDMDYID